MSNLHAVVNEPVEIDEPAVDILEEGLLHKVMVVFHMAADWPAWLVFAGAAVLAFLAGGVWHLVLQDQTAVWVTILVGVFLGGDLAILISLPAKKLSFGPWKAQFFPLALLRVFSAVFLSFLALAVGSGAALVLLVLAQLVGTAALFWGAVVEPFRLELSEIYLFTDRLPYGTPPIRILHITDLHVERLTQREERVLQLVKEARPDVIFITGDYVNLSCNRDPQTHAQVKQLLSQLHAPFGVYATLGSPPVDLRETVPPIFDGLDIPLMRLAWKPLDLGEGRKLIVMGMDCTHDLPTDSARLARLISAVPHDTPQVLLYHSPELMPQAIHHGIDLYLCGHTHGGQVRLPIIGPLLTSSQLGRKYVMGLYHEGRTNLYVSRGIGLEGLSAPRVRFLASPEMTLITLHAKG